MNNEIKTGVTLAALISAAALASAQAATYCSQSGAYNGGYSGSQWRGHAHAKQAWRGRHAGWRPQTGQGQKQYRNAEQGAQQPGNAQRAEATPAETDSQKGVAQTGALTQDQEDKIRNALADENSARVDHANFGLNVGASVSSNERLEPLPSQVVTIDPRLTGDEFLIVKDDIVIVDPRTNRVVALIPEAGGTEAGGGPQGDSQPNVDNPSP